MLDRVVNASPSAAGHTVATSAVEPGGSATVASPEDEHVFRTLARQARSRSRTQLWIITLGGAVDAMIFGWSHPMLSWLAAGCAATAAYGVWGLLDRAIQNLPPPPGGEPNDDHSALPELRAITGVVGTGAAVWAVLSFMATVLGNWNH